jgi:hypothetical protein
MSMAITPQAYSLAPETGTVLRTAQEALQQEASKAEAVNDPTGPTLRALSVTLGAMHRLFVDGALTIATQIEQSKQAVPPEELRRAVAHGIRANAAHAVNLAIIRNILIVASILVGSNVLTAGGMYWWVSDRVMATVAALDVRLSGAAAERWRSLIAANPGDLINEERGQCSPQRGGTACDFFLWTIPPPPQRTE